MISLAAELMNGPKLEERRERSPERLEAEGRKLRRWGWSNKAIAREIHVHLRTVEKWFPYE
jgi:DNA-binding NarL/FixJ family response regulator